MKYLGIWFLLLQITQSAQAPSVPDSPGVYYRQANGQWISLSKAPIAKTTTKGLGLFVETGGYTNLETDVVCLGAKALVRITGPRPTFYVRGIGSSSDAMLIQFAQKKDKRTFRKSSGNATVENKVGVKKEAIRETVAAVYDGGVYSVTSATGLKPGEYLLILGDAETSYDFGIDREK